MVLAVSSNLNRFSIWNRIYWELKYILYPPISMVKFLQVTQKLQFRIRCIHHTQFVCVCVCVLLVLPHNAQVVMQPPWHTVQLIKDRAASWKVESLLIIANVKFSQLLNSSDTTNRNWTRKSWADQAEGLSLISFNWLATHNTTIAKWSARKLLMNLESWNFPASDIHSPMIQIVPANIIYVCITFTLS